MTVFRKHLSLGLVAAALCSDAALAQDPSTAQAPVAAAETAAPSTAPVVIDGVELFRVRGVSALPALERASRIQKAIKQFGSDPSVPVEALSVEEVPMGSWFTAAGRRLFGLVDADAELEGLTRPVLAEVYRQRIVQSVTAYRHDRDPAQLRQNVSRALVATVAFALFMTLGVRLFRTLRGILHRKYRDRVHDVRIQTVEVVRGEQLWAALQFGARFATVVIAFAASYAWLGYVLLLFPWTRGFGQNLAAMLLRPLTSTATGLIAFIPNLVFLVILVMVARFAIRFNRVFFNRVGSGQIAVQGFDSEWSQATEKILRFMIVVFALIIAYPYIPGSGSEAFKGIGLLLGLMFSLGSPSVIGNLVAGLSLAFRRAFRIGDRVKIGEHSGFVSEVRLLTTYIRSFKNEQIVIPNSIILNSEVVNYTTLAQDQGVIVHSTVGIGYETPWRLVESLLLEAARRTPGIKVQPAPFIRQKQLGTFAVDYEINGYCNDPPALGQVYTAMHRNILDLFNEHGVQIMTPAYEDDPQQRKVAPRDQWFAVPPGMGGVERVVEPRIAQEPADAGLTTSPGDRTPRADRSSDVSPD